MDPETDKFKILGNAYFASLERQKEETELYRSLYLESKEFNKENTSRLLSLLNQSQETIIQKQKEHLSLAKSQIELKRSLFFLQKSQKMPPEAKEKPSVEGNVAQNFLSQLSKIKPEFDLASSEIIETSHEETENSVLKKTEEKDSNENSANIFTLFQACREKNAKIEPLESSGDYNDKLQKFDEELQGLIDRINLKEIEIKKLRLELENERLVTQSLSLAERELQHQLHLQEVRTLEVEQLLRQKIQEQESTYESKISSMESLVQKYQQNQSAHALNVEEAGRLRTEYNSMLMELRKSIKTITEQREFIRELTEDLQNTKFAKGRIETKLREEEVENMRKCDRYETMVQSKEDEIKGLKNELLLREQKFQQLLLEASEIALTQMKPQRIHKEESLEMPGHNLADQLGVSNKLGNSNPLKSVSRFNLMASGVSIPPMKFTQEKGQKTQMLQEIEELKEKVTELEKCKSEAEGWKAENAKLQADLKRMKGEMTELKWKEGKYEELKEEFRKELRGKSDMRDKIEMLEGRLKEKTLLLETIKSLQEIIEKIKKK